MIGKVRANRKKPRSKSVKHPLRKKSIKKIEAKTRISSKRKLKSTYKRKRKSKPKSKIYLMLVKALKDAIRIKKIPNYWEIYSLDKFLDEQD